MSDNKRRSISVRGTTYARLKAHCAANNTTCSAVVEAMIEMALEAVRLADASLVPYGPKDRPDDTSGPGRL